MKPPEGELPSFCVNLVRKGHTPITLADTLQCSESGAAAWKRWGKWRTRTHRPVLTTSDGRSDQELSLTTSTDLQG